MKIRTLLIEDDPKWVGKAKNAIEKSKDIVLIGVLPGIELEMDMLTCLNIEVVLLNMNDVNYAEVLQSIDNIIDMNPNIKVIVLSSLEDDRIIWEAYSHGAVNYVVKPAFCASMLPKVIRDAHCNKASIHYTSASAIRREFKRLRRERLNKLLTPQERRILYYVYQGKTTPEIHRILNIEEKTIDNHITSINRKLQVKNRKKAAQVAMKKGLLLEDEIHMAFI